MHWCDTGYNISDLCNILCEFYTLVDFSEY